MNKTTNIFIVLMILSSISVFGQDSASDNEEYNEIVYTDVLFGEYVKLENSVFENENDFHQDLYEIRKFRTKTNLDNRKDILSRLDMLEFIVTNKLSEEIREQESEAVINRIMSEEELRLSAEHRIETGDNLTTAAIGTTIVSGILFAGSSILYDDFYFKYTEADSPEQAAFYLFWWETFRNTSIISGWTTAAAALTSGIFTIIF